MAFVVAALPLALVGVFEYLRDWRVYFVVVLRWVPVPPIAEIQVALQQAVANITGELGPNLKERMRTGTVVTTDNRN